MTTVFVERIKEKNRIGRLLSIISPIDITAACAPDTPYKKTYRISEHNIRLWQLLIVLCGVLLAPPDAKSETSRPMSNTQAQDKYRTQISGPPPPSSTATGQFIDTANPYSAATQSMLEVIDVRMKHPLFSLTRQFDPTNLNAHTGLGFGWRLNVHAVLRRISENSMLLQLPSGVTHQLRLGKHQKSTANTWLVAERTSERTLAIPNTRPNAIHKGMNKPDKTEQASTSILKVSSQHADPGYLVQQYNGYSIWHDNNGDKLTFKGHLPIVWQQSNGFHLKYFYENEVLASIELTRPLGDTDAFASRTNRSSSDSGSSNTKPHEHLATDRPATLSRRKAAITRFTLTKPEAVYIAFEYRRWNHQAQLERILINGIPKVVYDYNNGTLTSVERPEAIDSIHADTETLSNRHDPLWIPRTAAHKTGETASLPRLEHYEYQQYDGLRFPSKAFRSVYTSETEQHTNAEPVEADQLAPTYHEELVPFQVEQLAILRRKVTEVCQADSAEPELPPVRVEADRPTNEGSTRETTSTPDINPERPSDDETCATPSTTSTQTTLSSPLSTNSFKGSLPLDACLLYTSPSPRDS